MMYSVVPIILVAFLLFCWVVPRQATAPGDFLGIAGFRSGLTGYDMVALMRMTTGWITWAPLRRWQWPLSMAPSSSATN